MLKAVQTCTDDSVLKLHVSQAIENYSAGNEKDAADNIKKAIDDGYTNPAAYFLLGYLYTAIWAGWKVPSAP